MNTIKINKVLIGEALVGEGNEVAHIDLIIGPRGSPAEIAFCNTLTNQKRGVNGLLAVLAPNLMTKPATVMFNKVDIKNAKQAVQMFGPAQYGVARAVADSVREGVIPLEQANDLFVCVGVFIHWDATDDRKIQDWNYEATKLALKRAASELPLPEEVLAAEDMARHPFASYDDEPDVIALKRRA
jgi:5,6,7,8-tetrahydromethanopterin hydro-lyase